MRKLALFGLSALLFSCGGDINKTLTEKTQLAYEKIEINAEATFLTLGQSTPISVMGVKSSGEKELVPASLFSLHPQIVEIVTEADGTAKLVSRSVGSATLQAAFGPNFELSVEVQFEVRQPVVESLTILGTLTGTTAPRLSLGTQAQLVVHGGYSDASIRVLSEGVTFKSSDETIATVSEAGLVTSVKTGKAMITAEYMSISGSVEIEVFCSYVSATDSLSLGQLSPNMRWVGAYGENDEKIDFSMEEFHCSEKYARYTTVNFIIGTGWCGFCPEFVRYVNSIHPELDAAGGLVVYAEVQDKERNSVTNDDANDIINGYFDMGGVTSNGPGIRIGDGETMPSALTFQRSIEAYPSALVVRRRDLKTIAYQRGGNQGFDFIGFARDPDLTGFINNCADGDEEASEPNDTVDKAAPLAIGDNLEAGICNDAPDFYQITHEGAWRLVVEFDHNLGDLDAYVWDTMTNTSFKDAAGRAVGSATSNSNETFEHSGPAIIRVGGFGNASAPYRIKLTAN